MIVRASFCGLRMVSVVALGAVTLYPRFVTAADTPVNANATPDSTRTSKPLSAAACVQAHESGQELLHSGQLLDSRTQLLYCSDETCPGVVRAECVRLLDELRKQVPSVVFRATVDGKTSTSVSAFVDNQLLFPELPTRAVEFNPGTYRFRFQYAQLPPIEREITLVEREKFVSVVVEFESPRTQKLTERVDRGVDPVIEQDRPVPWPVFALAGVGVVGLGGFIGFSLATRSKEAELRDSCSPACSVEQINSVRNRATVADVSLVIGGAALVAAGTYYFLRPTQSVRVGVVVLPAGGVQSQLSVAF